MRNVICIKWGDKFGASYVNRLYKMVDKNMTNWMIWKELPYSLI